MKINAKCAKCVIFFFRFLHILISFGHKLREELTLVFFQFRQTCVQFKRWYGYLMEVDYGYWWTNRSDLVVVYYKQCRIVLKLSSWEVAILWFCIPVCLLFYSILVITVTRMCSEEYYIHIKELFLLQFFYKPNTIFIHLYRNIVCSQPSSCRFYWF